MFVTTNGHRSLPETVTIMNQQCEDILAVLFDMTEYRGKTERAERYIPAWLVIGSTKPGSWVRVAAAAFWQDIRTKRPPRSTQPSIAPWVDKSSTSFGQHCGWNVAYAGWQAKLCDLIRHGIHRGGEVILTNCYILL